MVKRSALPAASVSLLVHAALFAALAVVVPVRVRVAKGLAPRETMAVSLSFFTEPAPPTTEPEPPPPAPPAEPVVTPPPPAAAPVIVSESPAPTVQMPPAPRPSTPPDSLPPMKQAPGRKIAAAPARRGSAEGDKSLSPAVCTYRATPEFPAAARRERRQGAVVVLVRLDADGRVESARLATSSGDARLDAAALAAARRCRFRAATRNGMPVASEVRVPYTFQLGG